MNDFIFYLELSSSNNSYIQEYRVIRQNVVMGKRFVNESLPKLRWYLKYTLNDLTRTFAFPHQIPIRFRIEKGSEPETPTSAQLLSTTQYQKPWNTKGLDETDNSSFSFASRTSNMLELIFPSEVIFTTALGSKPELIEDVKKQLEQGGVTMID